LTDFYTPRTALIDGDFIVYRASAWAHGNQGDLHDVVERVQSDVEMWQAQACCKKALLCLSCSRDENYRRDHYPLYKAHRSSEPPALLDAAKKALRRLGTTLTIPRLEADDIMGILATGTKVVNPVIVTVDKDLRGVPGWHLNPDKEDFPIRVTEDEADLMFFTQWLTGDTVDGFGGIKGVGAKNKLVKALVGMSRAEREVHCLEAYAAKGYSMEEALAQARCARILRAEDFDNETRTVIPWSPAEAEIVEV